MAAAPKMTERQQLAIALRESMTGVPTSGGSSFAAAPPSPAPRDDSDPNPTSGDEVSFIRAVLSPVHPEKTNQKYKPLRDHTPRHPTPANARDEGRNRPKTPDHSTRSWGGRCRPEGSGRGERAPRPRTAQSAGRKYENNKKTRTHTLYRTVPLVTCN